MNIRALLLAVLGLAISAGYAVANTIELRLVVPCSPELKHYPAPEDKKKQLCVSSELIIADANIVGARRVHNQFDEMIEITIDEAGQKKFAGVTENNVAKRMAFIADGKLITAFIIQTPIRGAQFDLYAPPEVESSIIKQFGNRTLMK